MILRRKRLKELEKGIERFNKYLAALQLKSKRFGLYRLAVFLSGLIFFLISFFYLSELVVWITVIVSFAAFGLLTAVYNKIDYGIKKCNIWLNIKKDSIARMNIDWKSIPIKDVNPNEDHPFESDLNITGNNSLHQLIDTSSSQEGSLKLKDWLLNRIPSEEIILERQKIVKELIPLTRFRNKLSLNANLSSQKKLSGTNLIHWLESKSNTKTLKNILIILSFLIPIILTLLILFALDLIPAYWSIGALVYVSIYLFNSKHINELFDKSLDIEIEFGKFSKILEYLEKYPYGKNERLKKLSLPFFDSKKTPSYYFRKLKRITFAVSFQKNPLTMLLLNIFFPYDFYFAYKLDNIKKEIADKLPKWLEIFYDLEALISLSNFGYLNPHYTFPFIHKNGDKYLNILIAEKTAHPLIPYEANVPNDFLLEKFGEVVIITGSNMSGKSTFLKTLGVNLSLAFAGGVVNANRFETNLFRIFTCIKISDSVTDGISYFYAEVKRLKELLNEIKKENDLPLFYLIDEIFRGTNNLERLIGSRSYIKALAGLNGTGLISTHDLELVKLENEIHQVSNYHFKEDVMNGKMIFDYKLRKGPSPTTNALKIMEIEGLPVEKRD